MSAMESRRAVDAVSSLLLCRVERLVGALEKRREVTDSVLAFRNADAEGKFDIAFRDAESMAIGRCAEALCDFRCSVGVRAEQNDHRLADASNSIA